MLLDDELPGLAYLRTICEQLPDIEVVRAFKDPIRFVEESKTLDFDFCILDIEMPGMNGLDVARQLKNKPVIFTTAYKHYAADAFDVNAIDYVRKPIEKERLEKAVRKVVSLLKDQEPVRRTLQINTNKGRALISTSQLIHISNTAPDKRDKLAVLETGEELVLKNISFEQLLSQLPAGEFARINKKDIVSLKAVRFFSHNEVKIALPGGELSLPLSDIFKKDFILNIG